MPLVSINFLTVCLLIVTFLKELLNSLVNIQMVILEFDWTVRKMTFLSLSVIFEGLSNLGEFLIL